MSKINGTNVLLYADGSLIACERSCTVNLEQDMPDATCKSSGGWGEHINGLRRASVDFEALYSTTGLSAEELIAYIIGRESIVLVCSATALGSFVMKADINSVSLSAEQETAAAVSGNMQASGSVYFFDSAAVVTGWTNDDFDTFTTSGTAITSAIEAGTDANASSTDVINVSNGDSLLVACNLTLTSGALPTIEMYDGSALSNVASFVEGVNIITLTATGDVTDGNLIIRAATATNFSTSPIYVFAI